MNGRIDNSKSGRSRSGMPIWSLLRILVLAGAAAGLSPGPTLGQLADPDGAVVDPQIFADIAQSPHGTVHVLVSLSETWAPDADVAQERAAIARTQEAVLAQVDPGEFDADYRYQTFPAMAGYITAIGLDQLRVAPGVLSIGTDHIGQASLVDSVPFIRADRMHDLGYTGAGVTVAVLDTGIDNDHPDLRDDIAPGQYTFLRTRSGPGAQDDNGHGTNVAGIITADGIESSRGVAPDADILAIKVLDSQGNGYPSDWIMGIDYVILHKDDYPNLIAINMSLGSLNTWPECPCDSRDRVLGQAILRAKHAGIVTFAASGNDGQCGAMTSPACLSSAVAVAAVYDADEGPQDYPRAECTDDPTYPDLITCFSNLNGCNELAAPGFLIDAPAWGGGTSAYTGTSQAAPHVAGVAALIGEKTAESCSTLTPDGIVHVLKSTGADTFFGQRFDCDGLPIPKRVNAEAALNMLYPPRPVIFVDVDAAEGGQGSSWTDAIDDLQRALANTSGCAEIWVAEGIYTPAPPAGDRLKSFAMQSGVALYGGFDGSESFRDERDPEAHPTILSGDLDGDDAGGHLSDNSFHVVRADRVDSRALLDGFTIEGGNADFGNELHGAGMIIVYGEMAVRNCVFARNIAQFSGGGVAVVQATASFVNCDFYDNEAVGPTGGGIGGAVYLARTSSRFINCTLGGNAAKYGGGIGIVSDNTLAATNCVFTGNTATFEGAGLWHNGGTVSMTNCTVAGNTAGIQFAGVHNRTNTPLVLSNSVVWGNSDGNGTGQSAQIGPDGNPGLWQIDYCCIQGWDGSLGGTGNVGADPLLKDPDGADNIVGTPDDDLRLATGSPVIDAADNDVVPFDLGNLDGDGHIYEITPLDRKGQPRFVEDPNTQDTGNGTAPIVDMGAFEFQGSCTRSPVWICDGDVDGDGQVNPVDSGLVQAAFGSSNEQDLCQYDVDCDGQINPVDSGIVQSLFGTCNEPRSACP